MEVYQREKPFGLAHWALISLMWLLLHTRNTAWFLFVMQFGDFSLCDPEGDEEGQAYVGTYTSFALRSNRLSSSERTHVSSVPMCTATICNLNGV